MLRWRKRLPPESLVLHVPDVAVAPVVAPAKEPKRRRTLAEVENDRIIAEQLAGQEREKLLEQVRAEVKQEWEAHRPRERPGVEYGTRYLL